MLSRRTFVKHSLGSAALAVLLPSCSARASTSAPVLVNHQGFTPNAAKFCVRAGTQAAGFAIVEAGSDRVVSQGTMRPVKGDLGDYSLGDFSSLKKPGTFEIRVGSARSGPFSIAADVYVSTVRKCVD